MSTEVLREHTLWLLRGGHAHVGFNEAVTDMPVELRGRRPQGVPHTAWRLAEHMRLAQWDILEFSRDPDFVSPPFPEGYWPADDAPPSAEAWADSVAAFQRDREALEQLVADPERDLLAPFPWGDGQTLLREALLVVDHTAYHVGQLIIVRRALDAWED